MAMLAASGVGYGEWLRFYLPRYLALVGIAVVAILIAVASGLQQSCPIRLPVAR